MSFKLCLTSEPASCFEIKLKTHSLTSLKKQLIRQGIKTLLQNGMFGRITPLTSIIKPPMPIHFLFRIFLTLLENIVVLFFELSKKPKQMLNGAYRFRSQFSYNVRATRYESR